MSRYLDAYENEQWDSDPHEGTEWDRRLWLREPSSRPRPIPLTIIGVKLTPEQDRALIDVRTGKISETEARRILEGVL